MGRMAKTKRTKGSVIEVKEEQERSLLRTIFNILVVKVDCRI